MCNLGKPWESCFNAGVDFEAFVDESDWIPAGKFVPEYVLDVLTMGNREFTGFIEGRGEAGLGRVGVGAVEEEVVFRTCGV